MASLLPVMWLGRRLMANKPADLKVVPVLNEVMGLLLALEARWAGQGRRLPFGTSLIAVARRD
ncbi:MAG: hypothetical protein FJW20_07365 [Acidimicrobiia bacterium]|nr:hypothetical protein [Acidimicrobiia bacterium]